jgi:hypothetical protein
MKERTLIPIQLESIVVPVATTLSLVTITKDLGVDVKVEETKATIMEE